jgi:hypothetical protein
MMTHPFEMFSPAERDIIKLIGQRKVPIAKLVEEYFRDRELPFEANNYIASVIRRITKKCEYHRLNWTIDGEGAGRHGRTVWRALR